MRDYDVKSRTWPLNLQKINFQKGFQKYGRYERENVKEEKILLNLFQKYHTVRQLVGKNRKDDDWPKVKFISPQSPLKQAFIDNVWRQ